MILLVWLAPDISRFPATDTDPSLQNIPESTFPSVSALPASSTHPLGQPLIDIAVQLIELPVRITGPEVERDLVPR
jgi:hypothetical protein